MCNPGVRTDRGHFFGSLRVLEKLIDWRNEVYKRIGNPFPTQEQLDAKFKRVSLAANALYNEWVEMYGFATPYLYAITHNNAYLHCDVVDRSAEALEHLNKIVKSIAKRGLKRYTSLEKSLKQRAKADAEGRSYVGLHEAGSGTCKHALTQSITRMELNIEIPSRKEYRERKKALEGKKAKTIVALDLATHIPKKPKSTE